MPNYYITADGMVSEDELKHYGVKGMRWGVRRAVKELHKSNKDGNKGGHNHAVAMLFTHRDKINKKMSKLNKKSESLESKRYRDATKNAPKIADLERRSAKARLKAGRARTDSKSEKYLHKSARLDYKASKLKAYATKIKTQIEKNEHLKDMYKKGLDEINQELITKGQDFLYMKPNGMPYTKVDVY